MCLALAAAPETLDISKLLKKVEERYNSMKTFQADFLQSQSGTGRITRSESGQLYLQKPGRMRWEYSTPVGKLFVSDGKYTYYYSPGSAQVSRAKLKESDDMRAPLAFLMGRLDFQRDFKEFRSTPEGENVSIVAIPRSEKAPYTQVAFVVNPDSQIVTLRITGHDGTTLSYRLSAEKRNPALSAKLFEFQMPEGATLVDEDSQN